jgi:hypothetical protein
MTDATQPPPNKLLVDLTAWPQVQCQIPATIPLGLAITALETLLAQLRQLYVETEIARRLQQSIGDHESEHDAT